MSTIITRNTNSTNSNSKSSGSNNNNNYNNNNSNNKGYWRALRHVGVHLKVVAKRMPDDEAILGQLCDFSLNVTELCGDGDVLWPDATDVGSIVRDLLLRLDIPMVHDVTIEVHDADLSQSRSFLRSNANLCGIDQERVKQRCTTPAA
jgi:hypothetical protein